MHENTLAAGAGITMMMRGDVGNNDDNASSVSPRPRDETATIFRAIHVNPPKCIARVSSWIPHHSLELYDIRPYAHMDEVGTVVIEANSQ